ncbi:MAG: hypothetical protein QNK04_17415 [Myxococcota bacterium]|nr:hypothetical protein [Myxococcota bacterium]
MRVPGWPGPVFFAALSAGSWEKWADVHIDFGAELYAAWRLAEGEALYRNIAYRHGPLPHHLNALWFTLFGVSSPPSAPPGAPGPGATSPGTASPDCVWAAPS